MIDPRVGRLRRLAKPELIDEAAAGTGAAGQRKDALLTIDDAVFQADFGLRPFRVQHHLADSPLFTLPRLLELARALPEHRVEYNAGNIPINLAPELTVNLDGIFWHPLSTDADMQVSKQMFPLSSAVERVQGQLDTLAQTGSLPLMTFT